MLAHELTHTLQQPSMQGALARKNPTNYKPKPTVSTDPVMIIRIDATKGGVVMETRSGMKFTGTAKTDLPPGTYTASAHRRVQKWVFDPGQGIAAGERFSLELDPLAGPESEEHGPDPWLFDYASSVVVVIGASAAEPVYTGPSVDERMKQLTKLINNTWTDGDDELAIINLISEAPPSQAKELLDKLGAKWKDEETYLDALDRVVDGANNESLHEALSLLRLKHAGPQKTSLEKAPVLPWHDVMGFFEDNATFGVTRNARGKFVIQYHGGSRLIGSKDFGTEVKKLPLDLFLGGLEFDAGQVIVVHDYDSGRFVPLVVDELVGYEHTGIRNFLGHVATVASFAVPVSAAESVAGRAAVLVIERVLPAVVLLIDENRLNIMKWWPNWGPKILKFSDLAKVGMAAYGIARFATSSVELIQNWKKVVDMRKLLDAGAAPGADAEKIALSLEAQSRQAIAELEKIQQAESEAVKARDAANPALKAADQNAAATLKETETSGVGKAGGAEHPVAETRAGPTKPADAPKLKEAPPAKPPETTKTPPPRSRPPGDPMADLNDATSKVLNKPENKGLKSALEGNSRAARALKRCASPCWPEWATPKQIAKLERILADAEEMGFSVNYPRIRDALRNPAVQDAKALDNAIAQVDKAFEEQKALGVHIAGHQELGGQATYFDETPLAKQLRATPGLGEGGANLTKAGYPWLQEGKVGLFPKQIADKMRGQHFRNFDEFREVFWQLVANDSELSRGWTPQNLARMRKGYAPFVKGAEATGGGSNAVWQLDHKLALANQGEVYNFDNLQIVTPKFHAAVGEKSGGR